MDSSRRIALRLFLLLVMLGGAAALAVSIRAPLPPLPLAACGLALAIAAEAIAIALPGGGMLSPGALVAVALLLVLGPGPSAWLMALAMLAVQGLWRRRPLWRVAFNAAALAACAAFGGAVLTAVGGAPGRMEGGRDAWGFVLAALAHGGLNAVLVSVALGLSTGVSPLEAWRRSLRHAALHHVSLLALGVLASVAWIRLGPWGVALAAFPGLLAYHAFRRWVELRSDLKEFVRALSEVLDEVDPYTRHHSVRVAQYSVRLGRALGLAERDVDDLECAALVHDLGKIGPQHQHILQKPGALTVEEQRTMQGHPGAGAAIVRKVRALRRAATIVSTHHERPDGHGYPAGLRTPEIPVPARILNVADAFDAMTSDRPYRRALDAATAVRELMRGAGTQFDRPVVDALVRLWESGQFPLIPSPSSEELLALRVRAGGGARGGP